MKPQILVVEDETIVAEMIKTTLQNAGYGISSIVETGEEAIENAGRDHPDLVLMDITLGGNLDGIETANHIRSHFNLPIVYLTGNTDPATLARARITEPSAYILKPFNKRELLLAIELALYKHQMEEARKQAEEELRKYREHLEELVKERTIELSQINARLEDEVIERKQAEAAIESIAKRFQTVIETVGEGITLSDETGYFEMFNSKMEAITGYTKDEANNMGGAFLRCLYPDPDDYQQALAGIQEINRTGGNCDVETRIQAKDGTLKTLLVSTALMPDQDHNWFLSVYRDITGRKQIEKELQNAKEVAEEALRVADIANRAKSEFLATMSHELRTPLNAILGYAQILRNAKNLTAPQVEGLDTIKSSGEHLLTLINDILDLSKIEAGRMELQVSEFHLLEFLKRIADLIRIRAEQKGITFVYERDPDLPVGVRADEKRLREVLVNLLDNAVKFTERGSVTLRVKKIENCQLNIENSGRAESHLQSSIFNLQSSIHFEVEDTGIGIALEQLQEIFLPFQQVREPHSAAEGTGLGLSISRRLVEMMGGKLHVKSVVAQGSVFWFELNLLEVPDFVPQEKSYGRRIVGYKGERRTILVVDDEQSSRDVLVGMLLPLGFQIVKAANGQEGVEQVLKCKPDLILLDLRMPVLDGFGATRQIRNTEGIRDVVIVAVSASVFEETRRRAFAIGFNDFLIKPFPMEELVDLLRAHLQLEWIYEDVQETLSLEGQGDQEGAPGVPLPPTATITLREFARLGMAKEILGVLNTLAHQDANYLPFVKKLRQFVKVYQFDRIIELLETQE